MRNRAIPHGHAEHVALGLLRALADGVRNLIGLAQRIADVALAIADNDQRAEAETPAALDHLGAAVDMHHALFDVALAVLLAVRYGSGSLPHKFCSFIKTSGRLHGPHRPTL